MFKCEDRGPVGQFFWRENLFNLIAAEHIDIFVKMIKWNGLSALGKDSYDANKANIASFNFGYIHSVDEEATNGKLVIHNWINQGKMQF